MGIHIDLAGPCFGHMFLVLIDAHTKWLEVILLSSTTSKVIIENLKMIFARLGLPETVVSDNASYFVSQEFENFLQRNGVRHITSAPYHPSSKGLAERAVQVFKTGMKRTTMGSLNDRISGFLFAYRKNTTNYYKTFSSRTSPGAESVFSPGSDTARCF